MKKDNIISQVLIIALILMASIIGTWFLSPLFALLGVIMAITSFFVIVMEYHSYQSEADYQEIMNQTEHNKTKQVAA